MELVKKYWLEREGAHVLDVEHGFAKFKFTNDQGCYIEEIFIEKDHRRSGLAKSLADKISDIARANKCKHLYGSVDPTAVGSHDSLLVLLAYGFVLDRIQGNIILFIKDL